MRIATSGATGLVGSAATGYLTSAGHHVVRLVRPDRSRSPGDISWDPASGSVDAEAAEGVDAVIHLAGESIAGRWTRRKRERIRHSRVVGTRGLCESLARLRQPPKTLLCASAIGYYGDRGDERLPEDAAGGEGFLAEVCREWEAACQPAADAGVRVVHLRFGMVLSRFGGALQRMLGPFRLGLGGRIGSGRQYWPWIAIDDAISVIEFCLTRPDLAGPVNVVAPEAITNRQFTKALGRVLRRPTLLPMPGFAARLALGQMAGPLLLASVRADPTRLRQVGFEFEFAGLESALRHVLER